MSASQSAISTEMETRLRRSRGRSPRAFSVTSRMTKEELLAVEKAAVEQSKAVGEWAREILVAAANASGPDVVLVELVATRMLLVNMVKMLGQNLPIPESEYAKLNAQVQSAKRRVATELAGQTKRLNEGKKD